MRRRLFLPDEVKQSIHEHLSRALVSAVEGVDSAWDDEDAITGHWGGKVQIKRQLVDVRGKIWAWSIDYRKFRGRGAGATEAALGADGLFELTIGGIEVSGRKTALFQSKKGSLDDPKLIYQCAALSTWREAAFVIQYDRDQFSAMRLDDAIDAIRRPASGRRADAAIPLDRFLGEAFLNCEIGDNDLYYDASAQVLRWLDQDRQPVHFACRPKHVVAISVSTDLGRKVSEPTDHRMYATFEDLLGIDLAQPITASKVARARKARARTYHPDGTKEPARSLFERRTIEINQSADHLAGLLPQEATASAPPKVEPEPIKRELDPPGFSAADVILESLQDEVTNRRK